MVKEGNRNLFVQPHEVFCESRVCGEYLNGQSTPTTETSLILAAVDFGGKYTQQEMDKVRV